ncbi:hypothetical protein D928_01412 [Enterococcus faecalis 20-SD-BW-06]|nr:hypothetical protein D928_01412 [Enterococcus faecalis 20-SD-BW-06]EPI03707.1 hypothetical protein D919_00313 [Enterococcus faecalis 20-SD-BW-08]
MIKMKKAICTMILSLLVGVFAPVVFATNVEASEATENSQTENTVEQTNDQLFSENVIQENEVVVPHAETTIAPIIIWGAGVIGGWLGSKLLDWGATKFCNAYRNSNAATKFVCSVIA